MIQSGKGTWPQSQNFDSSVLDENARRLVTEGNVAKFSQNSHLREFLLGTGNTVLVEASPYDRIWHWVESRR